MDDENWPPQVGDVWLGDLEAECPWPVVCKYPGFLTGAGGTGLADLTAKYRGPLELVWRGGQPVKIEEPIL